MFERLGRATHTHRRAVVLGWIVFMFIAFGASGAVGSAFSDELEPPDSEARDGFDVLDEAFGGQGTGASGTIVFRAPDGVDDPTVRATMEEFFAEARAIDGVTVQSPYGDEPGPPRISQDGTIAYADVSLDPDIDQTGASEIGGELRDARPAVEGLQVEIGGGALGEWEPPESELIGLAFAVVILVVSFGSVLAMGLPVAVAIAGVSIGLALVTLLSNLITVPEFATTIGAMIGIGVGIDYALFIVTRYREDLHAGMSGIDATAQALDTAGRAVTFAGLTVVVSLLGMIVMGLEFVTGLALSASMTVLVTMAASITLLPALLGVAGDRIEVTQRRGLLAAGLVSVGLLGVGLGIGPLAFAIPLALVVMVIGSFIPALRVVVPRREPVPLRETRWFRFSRVVQHHPWRFAVGGSLVLVLLALPVLGLRLGFSDEGNYSEDTTTRRAYDLLADGFGPGFNGPFTAATRLSGPDDLEALSVVIQAIRDTPGVAQVSPPQPDDPADPSAAVFRILPETAPQDEATADLVRTLRNDVVPAAEATVGGAVEVSITGFTPLAIDFTDFMASRLLLFFGVVLSMSFLFLMVVFRSLLVPLKAVIMNMLSIAAAYGVAVAVFQWGWFSDVVGVGGGAPIEPFIPMMLFAIVFGLSMDYEVFLLSRIKEEYDHTGDAQTSVADGLAATARVITAAAAIMVVVFGSFLLEDDRIVKLFGTGLAVAVLLDATLVRMLLVPATMELLGEKNWWLPAWLDRILPNISVEGPASAAAHHGALSDPEPLEDERVGV